MNNNIRLIPTFQDGSFDVKNIFYYKGNHQDLLYSSSFPFPVDDRQLHWRMDNFIKTGKKWTSEGITNCLLFDFDPKIKNVFLKKNESEAVFSHFFQYFGVKKEQIFINYTGFGIHIYLFFNEYFCPSDEKWLKNLALDFQKSFKSSQLEFDLGSFNARRTIRFPSSLYYKEAVGYRRTWFERDKKTQFSWEDFKKRFKSFDPPSKKVSSPDEEMLKNIQNYKKIDWQSIVGHPGQEWSGCRFIRWAFNAQHELNYHEWLAQLSLTARFLPDRGEAYKLARQFSEKYPKFDEDAFAVKFDEVLDKMYPSTCDHISKIWKYADNLSVGCKTCPHKKNNMPLNISLYANMENGFRFLRMTKQKKEVLGEIDYESFTKFLVEQKKIFVEKDGQFYQYDKKKKHYKTITSNQFIDYVRQYVSLGFKPSEIDNMKKYFKNHYIIDLEKEIYEGLIFFRNGVFNIEEKKLLPYSPDNYKNTYCVQTDYDPDVRSTIYEDLMQFAFYGKQKENDYFFKYITECLFTNKFIDKALILSGEGSNGKSSLMDGIEGIFTDLSLFTGLDFEYLNQKEYPFKFRGAKLAYCSDIDGKVLTRNINKLKKYISGEILSYKLPYHNYTEFKPNMGIIFGVNDSLEITENTKGVFRRFEVLEFENEWPDNKKDPYYKKSLKRDAAGIFNILVEKYHELKNKPYPLIGKASLERALQEGDIVYAFYKNRVVQNEGCRVKNQTLWNEFVAYLYEQGTDILREDILKHTFFRRFKKLTQKKYTSYRDSVERGYLHMSIVKYDIEESALRRVVSDNITQKTK